MLIRFWRKWNIFRFVWSYRRRKRETALTERQVLCLERGPGIPSLWGRESSLILVIAVTVDISFPPPAPVQTSDRDLPDAWYSLFPVLFCQSGCGNSVPFREDPGWQTFHSFPLTAKLHGGQYSGWGPRYSG